MRLKSFHVTNFQSIIDSGEVSMNDITCLVGKNEAGKTALLKALYKLNPILEKDKEYDHTEEYPRKNVGDYEDALEDGKDPDQVVKATFTLEEDEIANIEDIFGPNFLKSNIFSITKNYSNDIFYSLSINENKGLDYLLEQCPEDIQNLIGTEKNKKLILQKLEEQVEKDNIQNFIEKLINTESTLSQYAYNEILSKSLPKFLYFDEYYQIQGGENIDKLISRKTNNQLRDSDHPIIGLVNLANIDLTKAKNSKRTQELKNKLEAAGNRLTSKILHYWSQNKHIRMRFDIRPGLPEDPPELRSGLNIWSEVYDTRHMVSTSIGSRSRGFVWFFSFIAWYSQIKKEKQKIILLLDEPGLALHGRAQGDLLEYFDKELKPNHQIIYTTHSPFLVDPNNFENVRIVQDNGIDIEDLDENDEGTKVFEDIFKATDDSIFPLQGALGYDIQQSLFVGPNNLLVEGPSDLLYIQGICDILSRSGKEPLDEKWVIIPVGAASKISTYVRLLVGQKRLKIATLIDIQNKDRPLIEKLYKGKLLNKSNVLTFADFMNNSEADIEDMFEEKFYLRLVNSEYKKTLTSKISISSLQSKAPRILSKLETYFSDQPLSKGKFSHFRPARFFYENVSTLENEISEETCDRFEKAFSQLNSLL